MKNVARLATLSLFFAVALAFFSPAAIAKGNEFDAVCDHIEEKYQAKKVKIPFLWLARFAVGIVRPAGVKAFKVTIYKDLKFDDPLRLNEEMKATMKNAFNSEWVPLLRMRSVRGEHFYMNMREAGKNVKILLVSIQKDEAVVVRAKFNPDKLAAFIENPKIFGISLSERKNPDADRDDSKKKKELNPGTKDSEQELKKKSEDLNDEENNKSDS